MSELSEQLDRIADKLSKIISLLESENLTKVKSKNDSVSSCQSENSKRKENEKDV
jgi:hypothetical protein